MKFKIIKCKDCGKVLGKWARQNGSIRCSSCSHKGKLNPNFGKGDKISKEILLEFYNKGLTQEKIGKKLKLSQGTISLYFKKYKIKSRNISDYPAPNLIHGLWCKDRINKCKNIDCDKKISPDAETCSFHRIFTLKTRKKNERIKTRYVW